MTSKNHLLGADGKPTARVRHQIRAPGRGLGSLESRISIASEGIDQSSLDTAHPRGGAAGSEGYASAAGPLGSLVLGNLEA